MHEGDEPGEAAEFLAPEEVQATAEFSLAHTNGVFHHLALEERVTVASFGDALRVPGSELTLAEGMVGMSENVFLNIKNRSKTIIAELEIPEDGGNGIIIAQGGRFGGWALYVKDGRLAYDYNFLGLERYTVEATEPLAAGEATVRFEFAYDGGGPAKGGVGTLFVNDQIVGEGRIERTQPRVFSADETADV